MSALRTNPQALGHSQQVLKLQNGVWNKSSMTAEVDGLWKPSTLVIIDDMQFATFVAHS